MNPVHVLPVEIVRAGHHAIPVELHPMSTQSLWAAIITAAATVALAALACFQIRAGREQTRAAKIQSDAALAIAQQQAEAAIAVVRETREAAGRQWQPRVFAHGWFGRYPKDNISPDEMAIPYYLTNEGTGPAFNVEHGIELAGKVTTWKDQLHRTIRAGEEIPPVRHPPAGPRGVAPMVVNVKMGGKSQADIVYWARFENLLGERFEVRNFPDPTRPAEFRRVS
jgi:hypothetical protein